jgi:hypothetical protein
VDKKEFLEMDLIKKHIIGVGWRKGGGGDYDGAFDTKLQNCSLCREYLLFHALVGISLSVYRTLNPAGGPTSSHIM